MSIMSFLSNLALSAASRARMYLEKRSEQDFPVQTFIVGMGLVIEGIRYSAPYPVDEATGADFGEVAFGKAFEKDFGSSFGAVSHFHGFAVLVEESDPLQEVAVLVGMGSVFGADPHGYAVFGEPVQGEMLEFGFVRVARIERIVDGLGNLVEILFRGSANGAFETVGNRFEGGSGGDFEFLVAQGRAVQVRTGGAEKLFHGFFRTLRIADFPGNARSREGPEN